MTARRHYQSPHRIQVPAELVFDYCLREVKDPREAIVLLHGYSESGARIFEKLEPLLPKDAVVLAPNGPFPMPYKVESGYKIGFTWYIYDPTTDEYFIDQKIAVDFLLRGLEALKLARLPLRLIGFSQGGYLAPFLAQHLATVKQVIGIASDTLHEELELSRLSKTRIDAIHGERDEVVSAENSRRSHERLGKAGIEGTFTLLPGVGHRITAEVQDAVKRILS